MRTNSRAPQIMDPFDPSIEGHSIREGEHGPTMFWLSFYGMFLCTALVSKFGDNITGVIELAGLNGPAQ
jgi:hypothetical protein